MNNHKKVIALTLGFTLLGGGITKTVLAMKPNKPNRTLPIKPTKEERSELTKEAPEQGTPIEKYTFITQQLMSLFGGMHGVNTGYSGNDVFWAIKEGKLTDEMINNLVGYWKRLYAESNKFYAGSQDLEKRKGVVMALEHIRKLEALLKEIKKNQR